MDPANFDLAGVRSIHLGWHSPIADTFFLILTYLGLGQVQAGIGLLLLASKKTKPFAWPIVATTVLTGTLLAQLLKTLLPRQRPSNLEWVVAQEPHKLSSFPSGHTTTAFACATTTYLLARRLYPEHSWKFLFGYFIAGGVGLSRIYRGVHWPTDVLAGACAGIAGAIVLELILQQIDRRKA